MSFSKTALATVVAVATLFYSHLSLADSAHERVLLQLKSSAQISAGQTIVEFDLFDSVQSKMLGDSDLNISNEKKLHFIAYDPGLKEFQHVHPEFDGTTWKVAMNFTVDGSYFLWAQGETSPDSNDFSASTRLEVTGGQSAWPTPNLGDVRTGSDSGSIAIVSNQTLRAGKTAMLMLNFKRADGSTAQITPYLGAFAHVISTPEDGESLIHIHAMDGSSPSEGMLHVTFPNAGVYRMWVQFIDGGALKVIPLSVVVTN